MAELVAAQFVVIELLELAVAIGFDPREAIKTVMKDEWEIATPTGFPHVVLVRAATGRLVLIQ